MGEHSNGGILMHDPDSAVSTPFVKHETNGYPISKQSIAEICSQMKDRVEGFLCEEPETEMLRNVQAQVRLSMDVVGEALDQYPDKEISLSYNGGKDCLVLLILLLASLGQRAARNTTTKANPHQDSPPIPSKIQAVYIVPPDPFEEVDVFVGESAVEYHLEVLRYQLPMKKGLEAYIVDRPAVKAIFVGTRRTDPHGEKLTNFDPTDASWPSFMRVHPVIDWHYAEIWAFIRHLKVPYCPLYDLGYTSLGGTTDTHRNPHLRKAGDADQEFRPAYELMGDAEERLGRDWR